MRFILITIFIFNISYSQSPIIEWEKSYGGSQLELANGICQTEDGGYVFIGSTNSTDGDVIGNPYPFTAFYTRSYWIVKISSSGTIEWQKIYGGFHHDEPTAIKQTKDGGFIVSGYSESADGDVTDARGYDDFWILKLNSTGDLEWKKNLGSVYADRSFNIIETSDGGYATVGFLRNPSVSDSNHRYNEVYVVKLNNTGKAQWTKKYGGDEYDMGYGIVQTDDGGYLIAGRTQSTKGDITNNHGLFDAWILKINDVGILQWQKTYGGTSDDAAVDIIKANDGNFIVLGETKSNDGDVSLNHGNLDLWVFKITPSGDLLWEKTYGGPSVQSVGMFLTNDDEYKQQPIGKISKTTDNSYLICGATFGDVPGSHNTSNTDAYVAKINDAGTLIWQRALGGFNYDEATQIIQTADNGYIVAGNNSDYIRNNGDHTNNHGSYDAWIIKLNPQTLSVDKFNEQQIIIHPNPVQTKLFIKTDENTTIKKIVITDSSGKKILTQTSTGNEVNVEKLSSGVYFIEADTETQVLKSKFIKN
mgnify:CR=1 FL=1